MGDGRPIASHLGIRRARSMRFAAAMANLAQAIWDTYLIRCDVSNGSVTDGHFDWATPDVRAGSRWHLCLITGESGKGRPCSPPVKTTS
jgi:hypothetical protein